MKLNITLVFQALNFLIAYFILERFFFKIAFATVRKRDRALCCLNESLINQKRNVENVRIHVNEQWQIYRRALRGDIPPKKTIPVSTVLSMEPSTALRDKAEEHKLIEILEQKVITRFVTHATQSAVNKATKKSL